MWKAKAHPSDSEVATAKSLLPPNSQWHIGILVTDGHIQYRGAMHPNAGGNGTHPGVEVWTDIPEDQYGYKPTGASPMTEDLGTTTPEEREMVLAAAEAQGYPRDEVYSTIMIESGWKPHNWYHGTTPDKAAGGLIGFMPFVLKQLGWKGTPQEFRAQSSGEQAKWVGAFFALVKGKWKHPGDTYVATAASGYVGQPDYVAVYKQGTKAYDWNKVWDVDKDGIITVGDLRQVLLSRMKKAPSGSEIPPPKDETPVEGPLPEYYLSLSSDVDLRGKDLAVVHKGMTQSFLVTALQVELKRAGFYKGKIDGSFGPLTEQAIKGFLHEEFLL